MKTIQVGSLAYFDGKAGVVVELISLNEVLFRQLEDDSVKVVPASLVTRSIPNPNVTTRHVDVDEDMWREAHERFELIKPLIEKPGRTSSDVKAVASAAKKGPATIYRWVKRYEETGLVASLLRTPRSDKGASRLDPEVEDIVNTLIREIYLVPERPTISALYTAIKMECRSSDLEPPSKILVHRRVESINPKELLHERHGRKASKQKYKPVVGKFPGGEYPYQVFQMDHTPMDIVVVDEQDRIPIGRPFLTIAIDVASKVLPGFVITLEHPSALSVGLCVAHAVSKKGQWLSQRGIDVDWPMYGKMQKIHVDNGADFRSDALKRACEEHDIILDFRPKGEPNYGPHVERAFLRFMKKCHELRGTTFSNVKERLDYDSDGKACMTLKELEVWFAVFVTHCYHHEPHRGISNVPPINLYNRFIFGDKDRLGIGLPEPIDNEEKFSLDFMPFFMRTIQRTGVEIDYIRYYSSSLQPWIGLKDPEDKNKTRKYIFARDPRNISQLYFLNPSTKKYETIPCLDNSRPPISLWEMKAVKKMLEDDPLMTVNEDTIFDGVRKMRKIEQESLEKTRLAKKSRANEKRKRRMAERRLHWDHEDKMTKEVSYTELNNDEYDTEGLTPFSEIDIDV